MINGKSLRGSYILTPHEPFNHQTQRPLPVRQVVYDAKNAAHLIRLLRMGIEFLTEGTLHIERPDAAELLDIKRGAWPLEKVKTEAERLFELTQEAYVRSTLPPEPDRPRAERLCVEMISDYHGLRGKRRP